MKINEIHEELVDLAKKLGITIRRENGTFRSGYCVLNEQKIILFNKSTTVETRASVLAKCLSSLNIDSMFIKPAIRDFIDRESQNISNQKEFNLIVSY